MACTPEAFKIRFPEFTNVADPRIQLFLDDAAGIMGNSNWCGNYDVAQCYLAAHLLATGLIQESGDSGVIGPAKKQEVDDVIIEQAVTAASAGEGIYGTTSYGKMFLHYRQICFGATIIGV